MLVSVIVNMFINMVLLFFGYVKEDLNLIYRQIERAEPIFIFQFSMFMSAVYLIKRRFLSALSQGDRNDKAILTCLHSTYISAYDQIECDLSPYCRSLCQLIYRTVHMFCPFFLVNLSFISHHLSVPGFTLLPVPHCAVSRWCGISSFIIQ